MLAFLAPPTLLERYIFRIAFMAFALCLLALTGVIWITSAVRELDLVAGKGQTIIVFLKVTLLSLPALVMVVAPVALFVAVVYALNKLNSDSELIVMNAAGMPPASVLRPFALLALIVSVLVGYITIDLMPSSFRSLRDLITQIRADVVTKFLQEGRFTSLDRGITFHFREKSARGTMVGIMIHDGREPNRQMTYLAERGQIIEQGGTSYIVLEEGSVHRRQPDARDSGIVAFDRYVIDLDQFGNDGAAVPLKPRERTTRELMNIAPDDAYARLIPGRFRAELHERFVNPLYPFATMAIAFAALGAARTTRQGRGLAIGAAIVGVVALRIAGFGANTLAVRSAALTPVLYLVPVAATLIAGAIAWRQTYPTRRVALDRYLVPLLALAARFRPKAAKPA
jgi:lipopolysaccharide export system permease protein